MVTNEEIFQVLGTIPDPEMPISITDLAMKRKPMLSNYKPLQFPAHGVILEKQPLQAPLDRLVANQSTSAMLAGNPLKE